MVFYVMTNMGDRLRAIRSDLGGSQKDMAKRFGLGETTWQTLELQGRAPKGEVLAQLVEMGFSVDWLLTGDGQMRRDAARPPLDEQLLAETLKLIDDWLSANRRTMTAPRKAQIAASIYAMAMEDAAEGRSALDAKRIAHILKLAG